MIQSLTGIRVVSTAVNVPGPVACATLRGMGAHVTKIEPPFGDPLAVAAAHWYAQLCDGVEVIPLDLKSIEGSAQLHALLDKADLLVTATRPASLERLGLAWSALHARHRRLCQLAIVGYPTPRQNDAGHDLTYQSEVGLVTPPAMPSTLIADLSGAQQAVIGALALLLDRDRAGHAAYAEVALSDAAAAFAPPVHHGLTTASGWLGGGTAAYNLYRAKDGWVAVAALEPQFREALIRELGVGIDARDALARIFVTRTAEEWGAWGRERGLPLAAVR